MSGRLLAASAAFVAGAAPRRDGGCRSRAPTEPRCLVEVGRILVVRCSSVSDGGVAAAARRLARWVPQAIRYRAIFDISKVLKLPVVIAALLSLAWVYESGAFLMETRQRFRRRLPLLARPRPRPGRRSTAAPGRRRGRAGRGPERRCRPPWPALRRGRGRRQPRRQEPPTSTSAAGGSADAVAGPPGPRSG